MKDLLIVLALGLTCSVALVFLVVGVLKLRQQIRWYRLRRDIARDAAQRARLHRIMRANNGR